MKTCSLKLMALAVGMVLLSAAKPPRCLAADRASLSYDSTGLKIDGRDTFIFSGAFHYFRVSPGEWRDRFEKMKAAGFNGVETYVPWNYHERTRPPAVGDYSRLDLSELESWLKLADEYGFYVTIRPGPYICAEWDGGGFPQWLLSAAKPADWPADKAWLQTDDPAFLEWNAHWYRAVCRTVAPHQITRKAPGSTGVIFFQIENEFNRVNWIPSPVKRRYLEALARFAREGGIDVPLVTCWTNESRAVEDGPLRGVFDFLNRYPKWEVEKQLAPNTRKQVASQPAAPLMSMELQGGWYSEVGGLPSAEQDGIAPVQTQNLTLYLLQLGYSYINYYMLVGGTNFDDRASRETTTTYDFAAAIGEGGIVGERYARVSAIGDFLRSHGAALMKTKPIDAGATASNPNVQVAARETPAGDRYFFVRTENRSGPQTGRITFQDGGRDLAFEFELEPFGAKILHVPAGTVRGEWFPRPARVETPPLPPGLRPIEITSVQTRAANMPERWTPLADGQSLDDFGAVDRHFVIYRTTIPAGETFSVGRIGDKVVNNTPGDVVLAAVDGRLLDPVSSDAAGVTFPALARESVVHLLWENRGLHHHTSVALERHWKPGIDHVAAGGRRLPVEFASDERSFGTRASDPSLPDGPGWPPATPLAEATPVAPPLLLWQRGFFRMPADLPPGGVAWRIRVEGAGNGFLYVNGRCLGRVWEAGPQREFHIPPGVLRAGADNLNAAVVSLRPTARGAGLSRIVLLPVANSASLAMEPPVAVNPAGAAAAPVP